MGRKTSIRQPLLVYAVVFALFSTFCLLAFSGLALSRASRRAYHRAVRQELRLFAHSGILPRAPAEAELAIGWVSTGTPALGLSVEDARRLVENPERNLGFAAARVYDAGEELYVVAQIPGWVPSSIALVELSRIMLPALLTALAAAGLMSLLVYRLLLPSLRALADVAGEPDAGVDAPNEIAEIAHRFRETTRSLREARERAEAQRDELGRMQASLVKASKLASVGRLAAGIAHEIGNPLAAVKGYLRLLQDGLPPAQSADALARSARELDRIHATIQQLLAYARSGAEPSRPTGRFALAPLLEEALSLARGHPALRGVRLDSELTNPDLTAVGHPGSVGPIVVNLLLNAGHAVGPGGTVRVRCKQEEPFVVVEVEDDGPGVPEGSEELIFDPFFSTKAPGEGTGLGLAVSRSLAEAMGGLLELDLDHRSGARFRLRLPSPFHVGREPC